MKKVFAVIGLGTFGVKLSRSLIERGGEVIAIDNDIVKVESIKEEVHHAVCLDSTDEEAMKAAGVPDVDVAVVAIGERVEVSILTTAVLKRLGVGQIIGRAISPLQEQILRVVGATRVVNPEEHMGEQLATSLIAPNIYEHITLATGHSVAEVKAASALVGRTLGELDVRKKFGVNVVAIRKKVSKVNGRGEEVESDEVNDVPRPGDRIESGDVLVVVGSDEKIEKLARLDEK
jgi:trk system potassium uptake protein TrkA